MTGALMPMEADDGTRPIRVVETPMSSRVAISIARRPSRSPRWPASAAPTGRKKKLMPMVAKEMTSESSPSPSKNWLPNTIPVHRA
ncbi:UNVERIFIED_CONTAM: hypothetical protein RKD50_000571 [Streptomyces canus]